MKTPIESGESMKPSIHYPTLFLITILLNRMIVAAMQISPTEGVRALVVLMFLAGLFSLVLHKHIKDWHRTDFLIALFMILLLIYQNVYRWIKSFDMKDSDLWGLLLILVLGCLYRFLADSRLWKLVHNPARVTSYMTIVFSLLLSFQLVEFGREIWPDLKKPVQTRVTSVLPLEQEIHLHPEDKPDIYVIVLDAYGRQDVLKDFYGYDNSEFLAELKERGFYVADQSHSNYTQTPYAIASLMNFDYLQPWASSYDFSQYLVEPIQDNRVFQLLKEAGYTTVGFEGTTNFTEIRNSDVFYSSFVPLNKFERFLLTDTPLEPLTNAYSLKLPIPNYDTHRSRVLNKLETIKTVPEDVPGPKIVYFHVVVPHPPFVFDADGNAVTPNRPYSIADAEDYPGSTDEYRSGYRQQLIFLNKEIMQVLDAILAKSPNPPIIVLMGDHGPASMFNWDTEDPGCLRERTHNLYAVLLPHHEKDRTAYASMTPVNTFRVIFNTYFGTDLPLLDDATYLTSFREPDTVIDITRTRDLNSSCTLSP
jgi:hypothetical protein